MVKGHSVLSAVSAFLWDYPARLSFLERKNVYFPIFAHINKMKCEVNVYKMRENMWCNCIVSQLYLVVEY